MSTIQEDDRHVRAPWTDEQVAALNRWQTSGRVHPFTCGRRSEPGHAEPSAERDCGELVATKEGWICPECDYTQNWAHRMMLEQPPPLPWETSPDPR